MLIREDLAKAFEMAVDFVPLDAVAGRLRRRIEREGSHWLGENDPGQLYDTVPKRFPYLLRVVKSRIVGLMR